MAGFFVCELVGVGGALVLWLGRPLLGADRYLAAHHALQRTWTWMLISWMLTVYSMRLEAEGVEALAGGPLLLFVRHTSVADTVLPLRLVAQPLGYRARYVIKAELLWDPCLDIVGQRLNNAFIRRGNGASEIAAIAALGQNMAPDNMVVLFPEGTRFSPRQRQRRLAAMVARADPLLPLAESLQHTLPPHTGGALGLLSAAPHADVAFCAHVGFEGVRSLSDATSGVLVGRRVRVKMWRVPAAEIPTEPDAQRVWLFTQWAEVDRWVGRMLESEVR